VREIINLGIARGLSETGIFLCEKSVRDEGTSHYYSYNGIYVFSNNNLLKN
jgi:hypothetical protein